MTIQSDISAIKKALKTAEEDPRVRRVLKPLHNLLAEGLVTHGRTLGLTEAEIEQFGGGTPKEQEPEG